jgi:transcription termination factor Rho
MSALTKEYLESLLLPEVKKVAKKLEITNYSKLNKSEIITLILKKNKKNISSNSNSISNELEFESKIKAIKKARR